MPTDVEVRVMRMLSAIEVPANAAEQIEAMGTEGVTVVCEAALGSYPELRPKVRTNAAAVVGRMTHPQARETLALLITDENSDVAVRALRAAGRLRDDSLVERVAAVLRRPTTDPSSADEAVRALKSIGSASARRELDAYADASPDTVPHRASALIKRSLEQNRR